MDVLVQNRAIAQMLRRPAPTPSSFWQHYLRWWAPAAHALGRKEWYLMLYSERSNCCGSSDGGNSGSWALGHCSFASS
jgi:hypothetical protein